MSGIEQYHKERELIKAIVAAMTGRENGLEEWYTYHLLQRDLEIERLKAEVSRLAQLSQQKKYTD